MTIEWEARPRKNKRLARNNMTKYIPNKPSKGMLLFAGKDCLEIRLFQKQGIIGPDTKVLIVERNPEWARLIEEQCAILWRSWGYSRNFFIWEDEYSSLPYVPFSTLDLVHLDYFGNMSYEDVITTRSLILPKLMKKQGRFFMTFCVPTRGNVFMRTMSSALEQMLPDDFYRDYNALQGYEKNEARMLMTYITMLEKFIFGSKAEIGVTACYYDISEQGGEEVLKSPSVMMQLLVHNFGEPEMSIEEFCQTNPLFAKERTVTKNQNRPCLARQILDAVTPGQKAAATRRLNAHLDEKESQGFSRTMSLAGVKASMKRLQSLN